MAQYIDKATIVAEIKRRISVLKANESVISMLAGGMFVNEFKDLLSFLDTIEVKEVDLELNSFDATVCKNGNTYLKEMDKDAIIKALEPYKEGDKVKVIIKSKKGK